MTSLLAFTPQVCTFLQLALKEKAHFTCILPHITHANFNRVAKRCARAVRSSEADFHPKVSQEALFSPILGAETGSEIPLYLMLAPNEM